MSVVEPLANPNDLPSPVKSQVHDNGATADTSTKAGKGMRNGPLDDSGLPVKPQRHRPQSDVPAEIISKADDSKYGAKPSGAVGSSRSSREFSASRHENDIPISDGGAIIAAGGVSGWSHQAIAPHRVEGMDNKQEDEWQDMPAFAPYDLYDDDDKLIAREAQESDEEGNAYTGLGGAGKGYTRVQIDEDAQSATSMDDNTSYLFKTGGTQLVDEDDEQRDTLAQMQATKDLLTEGQRIAYVGLTRLAMALMVKELDELEFTKGTKKESRVVVESMKMWAQQMILRLFTHMEISSSGK